MEYRYENINNSVTEKELDDGCKFRPGGVQCTDHSMCYKCGWNPRVATKRKYRIRKEIYDAEIEAQKRGR